MYPTSPGLFHGPAAARPPVPQLPIGIVADTYQQAMDYVLSAPMPSPYHVILRAEDTEGLHLGGLALLRTGPLSPELRDGLARACGLTSG